MPNFFLDSVLNAFRKEIEGTRDIKRKIKHQKVGWYKGSSSGGDKDRRGNFIFQFTFGGVNYQVMLLQIDSQHQFSSLSWKCFQYRAL